MLFLVTTTTTPPKRALWSNNDLVSAVQAVQRGMLSTSKAAEKYKVPRTTIRNHLQTGSLKKTLGRKSILCEDQESDLVSNVMRFAEKGLSLTPRMLRRFVYKFCEFNNIKHNFNKHAGVAGKDWFKAFMKRHPEISRREDQFMDPAMAQKLNKFIFDDHFKSLNEIYDSLGRSDTKQVQASWDCHGCEEDKIDVRRQFSECSKWCHEECVGLSADDTDNFGCTDGC
ncbi:unnamed protein product [Parnassius mnemosyne]|uniref:HTH CENPB-type domain-containing protein n=1 Tax=Parnassius mnemosyne TaxID=213953 RepID=A0AAV1K7R7_9NEOP